MKLQTFTFGLCLSVAIFLFAQHKDPNAQNAGAASEYAAVLDLTHTAGEESTHLEAPATGRNGAWSVDQIPARSLAGPLVVINIRPKAMKNPDYELSMDDVAAWEKANGRIPDGAIVMAATGWSDKWRTVKNYRGGDAKGSRHFPGFSLDAVKFLVEARNVPGIGIDTVAVDAGRSSDSPIRQYTSEHNIYHLTNVDGVTTAPEKGAWVVAAPAKLSGRSEAPVRILAFLPKVETSIQTAD